MDTIRDMTFGQIIRYLSGKRLLKYPEEHADFECPKSYKKHEVISSSGSENTISQNVDKNEDIKRDQTPHRKPLSTDSENTTIALPNEGSYNEGAQGLESGRSEANQISVAESQHDLEKSLTTDSVNKDSRQSVEQYPLDDGTILVEWYGPDDPANPQNWSFGKKLYITAIIGIYTTAVYMGSSIVSPAIGEVSQRFGTNIQTTSLILSMYVLAYGLGPMIWSPLSEIPAIGRNPPYIITFFIFVVLTVPTALVDNFAGLVVLRFLQGFFGSPCLATGGASLQDMFSSVKIPYALCLWALSATVGPSLSPLIAGFSVPVKGWRWSIWEILFLAGPTFLVMFFTLPETNSATILLYRARRLRARSGNQNLKAQSELDQENLSVTGMVLENLYRPLQMMILDPAIGFTALYTALIYGIYYSFFEAFPLVYVEMYHFNLGEMGLTFLSITIGVIISIAAYYLYLYKSVEPFIQKHGFGAPERRLVPALISTFLCPIGLFIFAWTSRPDIHWIVGVIGIVFFTIGIFIVMQCIFVYLPLTYPQYAASLFAGNDLTRSTLATAAIHFSRPLFGNLGIGRGVSLLGGLTVGCSIGLYALWYYGASLRARSRFAAK